MPTAAIIGSGLIGRAWGLVFARAGWDVAMTDTSSELLATLTDRLSGDCRVLEKQGLCGPVHEVVGRIMIVDSVSDAVMDADFVQENGPEDCAIKRAIFHELDTHTPAHAVLASSTSAIVASRFTESLKGRARCLVGHPVNPPHLIPLVEVCGSPWTDTATIRRAHHVYQSIGQVPVTVNAEVDGFVLNRLQGALLAEAFRLVRDGVVSPEDLDQTIKNGLGLRWSFMGPFETIELNAPGGIADYLARYTGFYKRLADDPPSAAVFESEACAAIVNAWPFAADPDRLAALTDRRNDRLAALQVHKHQQDYQESPGEERT